MSKVTRIKAAEQDITEAPINVLNANLAQAHAILDLLHTLACEAGGDGDLGVIPATIAESLWSVMQRIEEAREAGNALHHESRKAVQS